MVWQLCIAFEEGVAMGRREKKGVGTKVDS